MRKVKIAVVLATYNRCGRTLCTLRALRSGEKYTLTFYMYDDNSSDGTVEKVVDEFPDVNIIKGEGGLYWSKGMHQAMETAVKGNYDFYLMVNDDVLFYDDAIEEMLSAHEQVGESCGVVGSTSDEEQRVTTYGGHMIHTKEFINPNGELQECDLANWNCFLVDRNVVDKVGLIDNYYEHSYGDFDYSLMMKRWGFKIFIAPTYIGVCTRNSIVGTHWDRTLSRKDRLKYLFSPKGMPIRSSIHYYKKNFWILKWGGIKSLVGSIAKPMFMILLKR